MTIWGFLNSVFLQSGIDGWTVLFVFIALAVLYFLYRFGLYIHKQWHRSMQDQIDKLAEDNRMYREVYLRKCIGLSDEEYTSLSAQSLRGPSEKKGQARRA